MATVMPAGRLLILSEVLHIYTRVSTLVQADEGMSLDIQRDLVPTLELIKRAVEAGELDAQIEAAAVKLRAGFTK